MKVKLHRNLTISAICEAIVTKTKKLAEEYNKRINENRKNNSMLIDKKAFQIVRGLLTHYAIRKAMVEQRATKDFADVINSGDKEPFKFNEVVRCPSKCELPLRFSLPCKHQILLFYLSKRPLPLSLFYPRWFLDGPTVVQFQKMSSSIGIVDNNSDTATVDTLEEESISLMLEKMPGKHQKIPGRTLVN